MPSSSSTAAGLSSLGFQEGETRDSSKWPHIGVGISLISASDVSRAEDFLFQALAGGSMQVCGNHSLPDTETHPTPLGSMAESSRFILCDALGSVPVHALS